MCCGVAEGVAAGGVAVLTVFGFADGVAACDVAVVGVEHSCDAASVGVATVEPRPMTGKLGWAWCCQSAQPVVLGEVRQQHDEAIAGRDEAFELDGDGQ